MYLTDITTFVDEFVSFILYMFVVVFGTLDGITFHGISLLDFSLALILLALGITLFINVVHVTGSQARANVRDSISYRKEHKND